MASETTATNLDIVSKVTGRGDGMGMNVAGGKAEVQAQALEYGITPADVTAAGRGTAGFYSAMASETRAADLDFVSTVTGRGDGMGMNIAGGEAEVQAQAEEHDITAAEVVEEARGTIAYFGNLAAALASRGKTIGNMAINGRNPDALRLGEQIGSAVMGTEQWNKYITTSAKHMNAADKPVTAKMSKKWTKERIADERQEWVFHHTTTTAPRRRMTDQITYMLPGSTTENPLMHVESLQEAISEAYSTNFNRFSRARNKDQKDKDAGMKLSRSH